MARHRTVKVTKNAAGEIEIDDTKARERTGTLFPDEAGKDRGPAQYLEVDMATLQVDNEWNARRTFDDAEMKELAKSIATVGLLQPIVVASVGEKDGAPVYKLINGYRRTWALRGLGWKSAPAVVIRDAGELELYAANVVENVHRADFKAWELADRLYMLTQAPFALEHKDIAARIGKSPAYVSNLIRLRKKLTPELWERMKTPEGGERISFNQWLKVAGKEPAEQQAYYEQMLNGLKRIELVAAKEARRLEGATDERGQGGGELDEDEAEERAARSKAPSNGASSVRTEEEIREMLASLSKSKKGPERDIAASVLRWVLGEQGAPVAPKARGGKTKGAAHAN